MGITGKWDDDMGRYKTVDTTRNHGVSDLSNMNIPMSGASPVVDRKLTRLKDKMQVFNILYMIGFLALFAIKSYIVIKKYPDESEPIEKLAGVVDVLLMLGTVGIYCILTGESCLTKCFILFGIVYNLASLVISIGLYLHHQEDFTKQAEDNRHKELTMFTVIGQIVATALSEVFLFYVLCKVIVINRETKQQIKIDHNILAPEYISDTSLTDEGSVSYEKK